MGYKLRREVRDWLVPGFVTPAERLVLLEIADDVSDDTREGWPGLDVIAGRTGLPPATVSKCLQRLAAKGLEIRTRVATGSAGRPVVAARGYRTVYRIPDLPKGGPGSALMAPVRANDGGSFWGDRADGGPGFVEGKGGQVSPKGRTPVPERADGGPGKGGHGSAPLPHSLLTIPSKISSGEDDDLASRRKTKRPTVTDLLRTHTDITDTEITNFVVWMSQRHQIRKPDAFFAACAESGDLPTQLAEYRHTKDRPPLALVQQPGRYQPYRDPEDLSVYQRPF